MPRHWLGGAFLLALVSSGCTKQYTERGPTFLGEPTIVVAPVRFYYDVQVSKQGASLVAQFSPSRCTTTSTRKQLAEDKVYTKASFLGGPGLALGGLALGGVGVATYASAHDLPDECADNDDGCTSKDEAKGISYAAWGLGAAGLIIGTYRALAPPKEKESKIVELPLPPVVSPDTQVCQIPYQGLPVGLVEVGNQGRRWSPATTDSDGSVAFSIPGDTAPDGRLTWIDPTGAGRFLPVNLRSYISAGPSLEEVPEEPTPAPETAPARRKAIDWCDPIVENLLARGGNFAADKISTALAERGMEEGFWRNLFAGALSAALKSAGSELFKRPKEQAAQMACDALQRKIYGR